ncbi:tyrosinase family protein [Mesorhizobium sp. BH1-1-4]|uniref:tyrosinase family protein n=1 Tax=Mesorhizobium sp. BH1-1-4 TaxID=2876662 RepID=UPI001CD0AABB|nr:tyrosinase family protein [Mesorhizobium sp. BH1-1-4]MBZ9994109.1 tyrosinase family protein [Mesorhizobium sp. BH1-1-4]
MVGKREDAWKLGAGWNETFLWYAKAVNELKTRPVTDRTSWRYLAAMHQFDRDLWVDLKIIDKKTPLPPASDTDVAWNQCQHSSFYFLPWHRGYLARFEEIIAATVVSLGGKAGWKLPYWNYLDATNPNARKIPEAFLLKFLPDGKTRNPLEDVPRYGQKVLGPEPKLQIDDIDLSAMGEPDFTGSVSFGGSRTLFSNPDIGVRGQLENAPHGSVHVLVGGARPANAGEGFLSAFETAGLDPLFWLHHCNIDRLWAAWMTKPGVRMEAGKQWLDGPSDRAFAVPKADGSGLENYTARDTLAGGKFYPEYDDLHAGTGVPIPPIGGVAVSVAQGPAAMAEPKVIGANSEKVTVGDKPVETAVKIAPVEGKAMVTAMGPNAPAAAAGKRTFLKFENIRGVSIAGGLKAYVNVPAGAEDAPPQDHVAGSAALFGLASASKVDGQHGGNGLTLVFDISDLARRLVDKGDFDPAHLRVKIVSAHDGGDAAPITIERVSVLRG